MCSSGKRRIDPRAADEAEAWCDNWLPFNPFPRIKP